MAENLCHLPDYCNLFKEFLVEELIFYESPFSFHFGKCSVIGKLSVRDNLHYLQNISLGCVDKEYCLKTGTVEILLLPTNYRSNPSDLSSFSKLVNGSFYEVHGETAFTPKPQAVNLNSETVTTMEMIIRFRQKNLIFSESVGDYDAKDISIESLRKVYDSNVEQDVKEFEATHVSAIQVHTMNEIDEAEKLIQTNLQLRRLRTDRRLKNY